MQHLLLKFALKPLLLCALIFGVRGFGSTKYVFEIIYGLFITLLLFICLVYSAIGYFNNAITVWNVELHSTLYFTICVELLTFSIATLISISTIIFIIKVNEDLNKVIYKLNRQCTIMQCEEYIYKELRRFSLIYVVSALFIYIFILIVQGLMWSHLDISYMICYISFYTIELQESMVEGQMLAICHTKKLLFYAMNSKLKEMDEKEPNIIKELAKLRKTHATLCSLDEKLNDKFGLTILMNLITSLCNLVSIMYFVIFDIIGMGEDVYNIKLEVIIGAHSPILMYIIRLITLAFIANSTSDQARNTQSALRKLEFKTLDKKIRDEISVFAVQLVHCPAPCYSVLGLFPLDLTMLASIFAAFATYMVILIQFHLMPT